MHAALKQAREDEALRVMARDIGAVGPRLDRIEAQLGQILALLRELKAGPHQGQRGGR